MGRYIYMFNLGLILLKKHYKWLLFIWLKKQLYFKNILLQYGWFTMLG